MRRRRREIFYSQDPCPASMKPGTMSRSVLAPAAAPAASPATRRERRRLQERRSKTRCEQEQAFRKRQQDQARAAKESEQKSAEAQRKEDNCRNARERVAQYEIGGRDPHQHRKVNATTSKDAQIEQEKTGRAPTWRSCATSFYSFARFSRRTPA